MQSLLEIYLYFILNDFWEDSEPANLEPHIFFEHHCMKRWVSTAVYISTDEGTEGKLLVP